MSKHTPAPWRVSRQDGAVIVETCDDQFNICVMAADDDGGFMPDATLIAASPELLAALREVVVDYRECGMAERQVMSVVRAAIAKAEGRR